MEEIKKPFYIRFLIAVEIRTADTSPFSRFDPSWKKMTMRKSSDVHKKCFVDKELSSSPELIMHRSHDLLLMHTSHAHNTRNASNTSHTNTSHMHVMQVSQVIVMQVMRCVLSNCNFQKSKISGMIIKTFNLFPRVLIEMISLPYSFQSFDLLKVK